MSATRSVVYCRISDDRTGQGLGVARQRADCEQLAQREGWEVVEVFTDNDLSAFAGKPRPAYERMLAVLGDGQADAVVAWHPDRFYRDMRDLEDFIDTVERAGAQVRTVTAGTVDLSTASGRMTARVGAAVGRHESEQKAERVRRKMAELAESGRSNGGPRTFGYEPDHRTVREAEAVLVREAASRALAGESLRAIAADWNERAIPTVRGAKGWTYQALRRMLLSPRHAGLRTHRGTVVGPAAWPAIIDRDTHERLKARLVSGRAPTTRVRNRLLTGLVHCGRCGARLYAKVSAAGTRQYSCVRDPGRGQGTACGRLSVVAEPLDAEVGEQVIAALSGPGLVETLQTVAGDDEQRQELSAQLVADEQRLEELAGDYAEGTLTRGEWKTARQRLTTRIEAARRRLSRDDAAGVLAGLPSAEDALRARWEAGDVVWRRAVVEAVIERVDVAPKGYKGGKRFDPGRIEIVWRA